MKLSIVTAPRRDSKKWIAGEITWDALVRWTDTPDDHKECGNYVLGTLRGSVRSKTTIATRSALTLDADSAGENLVLDVATLGCAALMHSTFQSEPGARRYRIIIPTTRECLPDEYAVLVQLVIDHLGKEQFDPGSTQPERYMFKPSATKPEWFEKWVFKGEPLDPDVWLEGYDFDLSSTTLPRGSRYKRDPFAITGVVGAFNRAYSIAAAIEEFELPYTQVNETCWTLVGSRAEAGLNLISEGLVFSHHVTDPAWNQTCSAFDLVRLHKFGLTDEGAKEGTPINRMPSYLAMADLATGDKGVVREIIGQEFTAELDDIADDVENGQWTDHLRFDKNGHMVDDIGNWDKVVTHEAVFKGLVYNELTCAIETTMDLPWRPVANGGNIFGSADRAALCHYLERRFKLRPPRYLVDELIATAAQKRFTHPLQDYLNGLVWDGKSRIETCLPGVKPTKYTRMVARKSMVAAAARMLEPGIKWDHTLVLFGSEGLGKSWWIDKVSRGHSASLGRIGDKDTLMIMHRSWVMIADEGYSLRKADADAQKEFLTRREDIYRAPYDKEAVAHKRHCVIWSTTNDDVFLRRQEGNRRFLIVKCVNKVDFDKLTDDYIDQLWAESVHLYRAGERLFLGDDEAVDAKAERESFTEEDTVAGVLEAWLDTLVPANWESMSPDTRKVWMANQAEGLVSGDSAIMKTCTRQLWFEALNQISEPRMNDLLMVGKSLKHLAGWATTGHHRLPFYGTQIVYVRTENSVADGSELL